MITTAHPDDPAPFATLVASTSALLDSTCQLVVFRYHVQRFIAYAVWTSVSPVYAVAIFGLFVFWIPEEDLSTRLQILVALFLTLVGEHNRAAHWLATVMRSACKKWLR